MLAEYTSLTSGIPAYNFIYAGDQRIAMRKTTGALHYYLNDHLGSARVVIDSTGTIKDKMEFYAFGEMESETSSTGQDYKYTGKPFDSDGGLNLYYYGARYYDTAMELSRVTEWYLLTLSMILYRMIYLSGLFYHRTTRTLLTLVRQ